MAKFFITLILIALYSMLLKWGFEYDQRQAEINKIAVSHCISDSIIYKMLDK